MTERREIILLVALCVAALGGAAASLGPRLRAVEATPTAALAVAAETPDNKNWLAVAPGRVEPRSGEIRIAAAITGRIGEVLVKVNDKVFPGEPLIRLVDDELRARQPAAEAQIAMRKRARNDQGASGRTATRRDAEDAIADTERAVVDARAAVDKAAIARRAGNGSEQDLEAARGGLRRSLERLSQRKDELRRLEAESGTPLPNALEGQLLVARAELIGIEAAIEKMTIRAPIAGTVLQINARMGELAAPSVEQPLVAMGDTSGLRVRAEVDERDFGEIAVGQAVTVRAPAFREREFTGKVASIAPIVQASRIASRDQRNLTDVSVAEVVVDLAQGAPLAVGMKVDVYFPRDGRNAQSSPLRTTIGEK
jgi:HlyD family secretion protein